MGFLDMTLRNLPFEHYKDTLNIGGTLDKMIWYGICNEAHQHPKFCANMCINEGWGTTISFKLEESQVVMVEYVLLPM